MMQHTVANVSQSGAACRVAPVQLGPRVAVAPSCGPRAAPLPPRARRCANRHHQRKLEYCCDCVADQSDDGDNDVRPDRRLEHRRGDEHGEPVLPVEFRTADVQRRHQQVERCERVKHVPGAP